MDRAVVLLSGGVDSTTVLAVARAEGLECHALSFDYGQRHRRELDAARAVALAFGVHEHHVVSIGMEGITGSALLEGSPIDVPKDGLSKGIAVTYVPARNTIFLSFALGLAESIKAGQIFIGVNVVDYSGYPDCRPEFLEAFERMANLATKISVDSAHRFSIRAPLLKLTKADIIRKGLELGVDYSLTWSCYDPQPDGRPCGLCDSCRIRQQGMADAGLDPKT
ncbi:MAG: 7-cyano-7-deazaguanine synthase QueC [Thermodesulfovibrionales bacterium]|nr:7-cyano-7-deazaguanine synthase QueC [Thermodesulfovibrionales bacterium]